MKKLTDLARVIRSKNAGPFELTLDILLERRADYEAIRDRRLIDEELIARLYGVPRDQVLNVVYFDPSAAVKANLKRSVPSGGPGDSDVYGAQQHGPLLDLELDL